MTVGTAFGTGYANTELPRGGYGARASAYTQDAASGTDSTPELPAESIPEIPESTGFDAGNIEFEASMPSFEYTSTSFDFIGFEPANTDFEYTEPTAAYKAYTTYAPRSEFGYTDPNASSPVKHGVVNESRTARTGGAQSLKLGGTDMIGNIEQCNMCAERKYQDDSDDSGVSFQAPGRIASSVSGAKVMSHEREHQTREARDARENGEKIISSVVRIHMRQCPECHKMYAAGGETRILKGKDHSDEYSMIKQGGDGYSSGKSGQEPTVSISA